MEARFSNEAHYVMMAFRVFGNAKDFRPVQAQMPYLADQNENDAYPLCQAIARQAIAHPLDLIITPSARRAAGSCAPVFFSTSVDVSSAEKIGAVVFSVDKHSQLADVRWEQGSLSAGFVAWKVLVLGRSLFVICSILLMRQG